MKRVLHALLRNGAVMATPGEFTKRAFLNGRIDLSQAEAVMDLIQSQNSYAMEASLSQLGGEISTVIRELREKIIFEIAYIESALDDPEHISLEDYGDNLREKVSRLLITCEKLKSSFKNGRIIREGINTVILGRPNAGKSSIINRFIGEERLIVSNIAGTTRDAVDTKVENEYGKFTFIDTAGIRRSSKINDKIEKYSVLRAHMAVERADVCLILIDANEGITEQDEKIAGIAHEAGKASIVIVNKWDSIEKDNSTVNEFTRDINTSLAYMSYAPILFVSAKTGQRVREIYKHIQYVFNQTNTRVPTGMLNDVLGEATMRVQPPSDKGRRLKIYYMTQVSVAPPTFVIFCNDVELFHFSYRRYIENCIRDTFGFKGTPIHIIIRQKGDEV